MLAILLLMVALFGSIWVIFHFQTKIVFFIITLPLIFAILMLLVFNKEEFIEAFEANYDLWWKSDAGQASGWPSADKIGSSVQHHRVLSDKWPLGFFWEITLKNAALGELDYLKLKCSKIGWNSEKDHNYSNEIYLGLSEIESRSPAQQKSIEKSNKYLSHDDPKELREAFKKTFGIDPLSRRKRHSSNIPSDSGGAG